MASLEYTPALRQLQVRRRRGENAARERVAQTLFKRRSHRSSGLANRHRIDSRARVEPLAEDAQTSVLDTHGFEHCAARVNGRERVAEDCARVVSKVSRVVQFVSLALVGKTERLNLR